MASTATTEPVRPQSSIKETLIAITIAFTMAFIFRGFVIEGFLIPTGSMAPTLLGKHMRVLDEDSGYEWTVGPWDYSGERGSGVPLPRQGSAQLGPVQINDPMTGKDITKSGEPILPGDRLFVLKYLSGIYEPQRWEVVVFKAPHVPQENYIKRLIGLPGEQLALVDGDVFTRPFVEGQTAEQGVEAWTQDDWRIARKPERVQRAMWQPIFDATFTPPEETQQSLSPSQRFRSPWQSPTPGWSGLDTDRSYRYESASPTSLTFDTQRYPIDDYTSYNQTRINGQAYSRVPSGDAPVSIFPVSDIAVSAGIEPEQDGLMATMTITARGWDFQAGIIDQPDAGYSDVGLRRRPADASDDTPWQAITIGKGPRLTPGQATRVEFWHTDQSLWLFMDGQLVAGGAEDGAYELTPAERVEASTGRSLESLIAANPMIARSALGDPSIYRRPSVGMSFSGGPLTLHHARVDRDVFYQTHRQAQTLGSHPNYFATLSDDHFFLCGDNSPSSHDARLWGTEPAGGIDPWVSVSMHGLDPADPTASDAHNAGLVHRHMVIGRAFVVYLPAFDRSGPLPVMLDTGRMRWVW